MILGLGGSLLYLKISNNVHWDLWAYQMYINCVKASQMNITMFHNYRFHSFRQRMGGGGYIFGHFWEGVHDLDRDLLKPGFFFVSILKMSSFQGNPKRLLFLSHCRLLGFGITKELMPLWCSPGKILQCVGNFLQIEYFLENIATELERECLTLWVLTCQELVW